MRGARRCPSVSQELPDSGIGKPLIGEAGKVLGDMMSKAATPQDAGVAKDGGA
jgi:hypothetical protein